MFLSSICCLRLVSMQCVSQHTSVAYYNLCSVLFVFCFSLMDSTEMNEIELMMRSLFS